MSMTKPAFPLAAGKTALPVSAARTLGRKLTKNWFFGFGFIF